MPFPHPTYILVAFCYRQAVKCPILCRTLSFQRYFRRKSGPTGRIMPISRPDDIGWCIVDKHKKVEQALGVACAAFLSSWPGVFASCGASSGIYGLRVSHIRHYSGTGACLYACKRLKAGCAAQPKGCSACFVPVVAINKPDFLAGYSLFYESARYRGDFLAAIENNRNFTLSRHFMAIEYNQNKPRSVYDEKSLRFL